MLSLRNPISYRVVTEENIDRFRNVRIFEIGEWELQFMESRNDRNFTTLNARMAVGVAQLLVFDRTPDKLVQHYLVYHNEEHDIFIVITNVYGEYRDRGYRILVCGRTGGLLLVQVTRGLFMNPVIPPDLMYYPFD